MKTVVYYEFTVTADNGKKHVVKLDELFKAKNAESLLHLRGYKCSSIRTVDTGVMKTAISAWEHAKQNLED